MFWGVRHLAMCSVNPFSHGVNSHLYCRMLSLLLIVAFIGQCLFIPTLLAENVSKQHSYAHCCRFFVDNLHIFPQRALQGPYGQPSKSPQPFLWPFVRNHGTLHDWGFIFSHIPISSFIYAMIWLLKAWSGSRVTLHNHREKWVACA